jgi:Phage tail lysozyme
MADKFVKAIDRMLDVGLQLANLLLRLVGLLGQLDTATSGWSTVLLVLIGTGILGNILKLASAFGALGSGIAGAGIAATGLLASLAGIAGWMAGGWLHDQMSPSADNKLGEFIARIMALFGSKSARESLALANPLQYLQDGGHYTTEQAMGLLANLKAESNLNPNAQQKGGPGYGIAQWDAARQADFAKWAGHDIHGSDLSEQLNFAMYELNQGKERESGELLRQQDDPGQAAYLLSMNYERPKGGVPEAERRAGLAADMQNTFNITINGVKDADDAGRKAEAGVSRAARNFVGNVQ